VAKKENAKEPKGSKLDANKRAEYMAPLSTAACQPKWCAHTSTNQQLIRMKTADPGRIGYVQGSPYHAQEPYETRRARCKKSSR
jgi:hypothetical protein